MDPVTVIGLIAAACTTFAYVPQAVKTIKTKNTKSLSLIMYVIMTVGIVLWLSYGILLRDLPIICLLYTSPSPRDKRQSRMPSSA